MLYPITPKLPMREKKQRTEKTLWCSGYHYSTTLFNKARTQVLCRFKSCSQCVRDWRWWRSLTMVLAGNKAKCLSSVNHTIKTIHSSSKSTSKLKLILLMTPPWSRIIQCSFESQINFHWDLHHTHWKQALLI